MLLVQSFYCNYCGITMRWHARLISKQPLDYVIFGRHLTTQRHVTATAAAAACMYNLGRKTWDYFWCNTTVIICNWLREFSGVSEMQCRKLFRHLVRELKSITKLCKTSQPPHRIRPHFSYIRSPPNWLNVSSFNVRFRHNRPTDLHEVLTMWKTPFSLTHAL